MCYSGHAQGTFQNLNFESASIVPVSNSAHYPYEVYTSSAVPGWTVYREQSQQNTMIHNTQSLSGSSISIYDTASREHQPIAGNYSVYLLGSASSMAPISVSIAQSGNIASDVQSLRFRAWGSNFDVRLNGQSLALVPLSSSDNHTVYGADISSFAGTFGELRFTAQHAGSVLLDSINFSPVAVPEPNILTVATAGIGLLLLVRRASRR